MKKKPIYPLVLLAFVSVFWALAYLVMKDVHVYISTNSLIIIRSGIAAFLVLLYILVFKRKTAWQLLKNKYSIRYGLVLGIFAALIEMLQSYAAEYTSESNSAFLAATSIVMVPFGSYFVYKLPITKKTIYSVIIVMIGVTCLTLLVPDEIGSDTFKGNLVALSCAFVLTADIVIIRRLIRSAEQLSLYFYQFFFGLSIGWICGKLNLFGGFYIDESKLIFDSFEGMKDLVFPVLYLSLFSTLYAYIVMDWAQLYILPTTEAIFSASEPIYTLFFMWLIRNQLPTSIELIGLLITFTGIILYLLQLIEIKPLDFLENIFKNNKKNKAFQS